ncbi:enoyl-CoA hydratase/isomerase family protein [Verticiella sediminum]
MARLTLDRPQLGNALSAELVEALLAALAQAEATAGIHTVLLRGNGRHFCTGFDLSTLDAQSDGDLLHRFVRVETLLAALWHSPLRTAVLAQGRTWGAGADLVAACESRAAAARASFRFPGARFGLVLGTRRLAERIGADRARRWVLDGHEAPAAEACAAGLVESVLAEGDEDGWCAALRESSAVAPATAARLRMATRLDARDHDLAALVRSAADPGLRERIRAYVAQNKKS